MSDTKLEVPNDWSRLDRLGTAVMAVAATVRDLPTEEIVRVFRCVAILNGIDLDHELDR